MDKRGPKIKIPENITREHILEAIKEIKIEEIPIGNRSKKYDLLANNDKRFPPKVVISVANKFVNGKSLDVSKFSGGEQTANKFLEERGFKIVSKNDGGSDFEYESYSWKILSNLVAIKQMDKSSFLHHGTGIPIEIRSFFDIDSMKVGDKRQIVLSYRTTNFVAHFEMVNENNPRTRMLWKSDFQKVIQTRFPEWFDFFNRHGKKSNDTPTLKFVKKTAANEYDIEFNIRSHSESSSNDDSNPELESIPEKLSLLKSSDNSISYLQTDSPNCEPIVSDSKPRKFVGRKTDYLAKNQKNTDLGDAGELAVIEIEKAILRKANAPRMIEKIEHVAKTQGDGLGYDIQSITPEGKPKFIEVKTTTSGKSEPFILSETEFICSHEKGENYYLYRLYDFDKTKTLVKYFVIEGDLTHQTSRKPIQFICVPIIGESRDKKYPELQGIINMTK